MINPFEAAVAAAAMIIGAAGLQSTEAPAKTLTEVWGGNAWLYFALLLFGGVMTLLGICFTLARGVANGPSSLLWRAGLTAITSAWGIYGLALMIAGNTGTAAGLLLVLSVAALVRIIQLSRTKPNRE